MSTRSSSRALVAIDSRCCPACGAAVQIEIVETDALFRHGGLGATRRVTHRYCRCGWSLLAEDTEIRPSVSRVPMRANQPGGTMAKNDKDKATNRGQDRSAEARQRAQDRGANAYGPGGNPDKGDDDVEVPEEPTTPEPAPDEPAPEPTPEEPAPEEPATEEPAPEEPAS